MIAMPSDFYIFKIQSINMQTNNRCHTAFCLVLFIYMTTFALKIIASHNENI